ISAEVRPAGDHDRCCQTTIDGVEKDGNAATVCENRQVKIRSGHAQHSLQPSGSNVARIHCWYYRGQLWRRNVEFIYAAFESSANADSSGADARATSLADQYRHLYQ